MAKIEVRKSAPGRLLLVSLAFLVLTWYPSFGASGKVVQLNQQKIHWEYSEGNFETVTHLLEDFLKSKNICSQADSVFLNKHLGVVYAANPNTREKGKYYFFKMLELSPDADLSDMFVSEDIDALFTKVKLENAARKRSSKVDESELVAAPWKSVEPSKKAAPDSLPKTPVASATKPSPRKSSDPELKSGKSSSHALLWTMAGTGVVAAAAGTYFLFSERSAGKSPTVYTVPVSNPAP